MQRLCKVSVVGQCAPGVAQQWSLQLIKDWLIDQRLSTPVWLSRLSLALSSGTKREWEFCRKDFSPSPGKALSGCTISPYYSLKKHRQSSKRRYACILRAVFIREGSHAGWGFRVALLEDWNNKLSGRWLPCGVRRSGLKTAIHRCLELNPRSFMGFSKICVYFQD